MVLLSSGGVDLRHAHKPYTHEGGQPPPFFMTYVTVALLSPPYGTLTYAMPAWWPEAVPLRSPGLRVAVPLGNGALRAAVLLDKGQDTAQLPQGVTVRPLVWPLESAPLLSAEYLEMVRQLALRQYRTPGNILGHMLPQGLRTTQVRLRHFTGDKPTLFSLKALAALPEEQRAQLAAALAQGHADMVPARSDAAEGEVCVLRVDPPWPVRPLATRQIAVLEYLLEHGTRTRRALLDALGDGAAPALDALLRHGHVAIRPVDEDDAAREEQDPGNALLPPPPSPFALSQAQRAALEAFTAALDSGVPASHLLFGVTGSGKTAVYLELAKACLARGRSLLLLAPEVALALKLRRDAQCALPDAPIYLYHGYQSPARREALFRQLATSATPCVVVGTRSALFLPTPLLGAVVLDEEHDASFKQDEKLTYQAKEVAWFLVAQRRGLLVLGSATPDMKTFYAAQSGSLPMQRLPQRVGGSALPSIQLVDISGQTGDEGLLAPESTAALKAVLARGEQAVVLLNRRGYAPLMYCLDCHKVARCPHCEIGLTYHKGRERLVCHYCGYSLPFPVVCPHCKGMHYLPMGEGTEKLAENLALLAGPQGNVLRLDRDSTRRPGRMEEILEAFARQEAQILVGTQMLSKGHHFPNVTLALVADGDLGLNLPDYRAAERTFQLLMQSAGRAGRGQKSGSVIIQTRETQHYCWDFIQRGDFEGFYAEEIARREKRRYPPFVRLALIRMSFAVDYAQGPAELSALGATLRTLGRAAGLSVLGPAPAPLALLRGRKRFHCLLKGQDWNTLRQVFAQASQTVDPRHIRILLDLDPVNML